MNIKPSDFKRLNFQPGSRRGLAKTLAKVLAQNGETDASKKAWDFVIMMPDDFIREDVEELLVKLMDKDSSSSKPLSKPEPIKKEATSVNAQAREMLSAGKTVSEIAKALNKSYQRIRNVQIIVSQSDKHNS